MKTVLSILIAMGVCVMLTACNPLVEDCKKFKKVRIVAIEMSEEMGEPDYKTIVEFPDKTRRRKYGKWGEVGDTFMACKDRSHGWK